MLERVLEPEVMSSQTEAVAYDQMDHHVVNDAFVRDFLSAGPATGEILDLGTGTALIPIRLCRLTPEEVRVFAVDLSVEMLDIARLNIEVQSLIERIMLGRCDAKHLDLDDDRFDAVMSNSIIHHIADPSSTFAEAVRVCKPGGLLFFRDLIRPATIESLEQLVSTYASEETAHAQQMFYDSLRAAFTVPEIQQFVTSLGFAPDCVRATSDRHWTWQAVK